MNKDIIIIEALEARFVDLEKSKESQPLKIDVVQVPFSVPKTLKSRAKANLKAIQLITSKLPSEINASERDEIKKYTGWGGFKSVSEWNEKIKDPNWIITDDAVTYEYYTPYALTYSIQSKILPILNGETKQLLRVPKWDKKYLALEASAGIGRFVDPLYDDAFQWNTIEPAMQSATILMALYPESQTNITTFDSWAYTNDPVGIYSLVLGNPPYKSRGNEILEDPEWSEYKRAEQYQLIRTLPMLNKGGLSVMVVPRGTMTGDKASDRKVRQEMLKYAHLIAAVRLPTHSIIDGKLKDALFYNVGTPIDVIFLQARGGKLKDVMKEDEFILNGDYFQRYPGHVMGVVNEPNTSITINGQKFDNKFMFTRIIMDGKFEGLPDFQLRPISRASKELFSEIIGAGTTSKKKRKAEKLVRKGQDLELDESTLQRMSDASQEAYNLVPKILSFTKNIELKTDVSRLEAHAVREGINNDLKSFVEKYGNPRAKNALSDLERIDPNRYRIFVGVFTKDGNPISSVAKPLPLRFEYEGNPKDYNSILNAWYRHAQKYTQFPTIKAKDLNEVRRVLKIEDNQSFVDISLQLASEGWCLHPSASSDISYIVPESRYYEGDLWPKYDAMKEYIEQPTKKNPSSEQKAVLDEIYKKQISKMVTVDPKTQQSLMQLETFPDLLNQRKILPNSPFVSESLLNEFFQTLTRAGKVKQGMGTLSEPKIVIDKDTYYIEARKLDIVQAMEKLLNTTRKFTIDLVKDTYPGPAIVAEVFPEIWSILESDIDYSGYYTDDTSNTEKLKSHVNKKNVWVRLSTDELRPKKGFGSSSSSRSTNVFRDVG